MRRVSLSFIAFFFATISLTAAPPSSYPNDREWGVLANDYAWLDSLRSAQPVAPPNAGRKQSIQTMLTNLQKVEPVYVAFMTKLREYYTRTGDARAAKILAREKIIVGDQYIVLSRFDRAIDLYREALAFDPGAADARSRISLAESRRFVSMTGFASVKAGMKEADARVLVGYPREDWVKQVVQGTRAYTVWIYPKADGGAAAIYFDNGVVYHTNWNAASPQATSQTPDK